LFVGIGGGGLFVMVGGEGIGGRVPVVVEIGGGLVVMVGGAGVGGGGPVILGGNSVSLLSS